MSSNKTSFDIVKAFRRPCLEMNTIGELEDALTSYGRDRQSAVCPAADGDIDCWAHMNEDGTEARMTRDQWLWAIQDSLRALRYVP